MDVIETTALPEHELNVPAPDGGTGRSCGLRNVLLLLVVAIVATAPGWFAGRVYVPMDSMEMFAPWHAPGADVRPGNEVLLDQTVQFVPWTKYAVSRLMHRDAKSGAWSPQVPLWNPYQQLGVPFVANGQSAVFFPTMVLHMFLPPTWSWTLSAMLKMWVAGCGVYVLMGRYGVGNAGRLLAAITFMLCGFNVVWLNHPHTNVMVLLPWAIVAMERVIDRPGVVRIAVAAMVFGLQFLGGHPASCMHLLLTCGLVYLMDVLWLRRGAALKAAPAVVVALGCGFALAGLQWLPLMDYVNGSSAANFRAQELQNEIAHVVTQGDESPLKHAVELVVYRSGLVLGTVFPYANGFPPDRIAPYQMNAATHLPNTNELAGGFVGIIPLMLAMAALFGRPGRVGKAWAIIGAIAVCIAVKLPGVDHVIRHVPGLKLLQNGRLMVTAGLAVSILAGMGLEKILGGIRAGVDMPRLKGAMKFGAIALAVVSIVLVTSLVALESKIIGIGERKLESSYASEEKGEHEFPKEHYLEMIPRVHQELVLTSIRLLIPATMLGMGWWLLRRKSNAPWLWIGIALTDLLAFAIPYNAGAPAAMYEGKAAALDWLKDRPRASEYRMAATYRSVHPDLATGYGLRDMRGYDAVTMARYHDWMLEMDEQDSRMMQSDIKRLYHPEKKAMGLLGLKWLLTAPDHPLNVEGWKQVYPADGGSDDRALIYENANALPRFWLAQRAEWLDTPEDVRARVEKFDFDPKTVVLVDRQMTKRDAEIFAPSERDFNLANPSRQSSSGGRGVPVVTVIEDQPEHIKLQVNGSGGGWLVMADTYAPGWIVKMGREESKTSAFREFNQYPSPPMILPAYGIMRAIPLPPDRSVTLILEYQPMAWKHGLYLSGGGAILVILLLGLGLIPSRELDTTGETIDA